MRDSKQKPDFVAIARFRATLRSFEKAAEVAAERADLTMQRYLLLLMVKGAPSGDERATITDIAGRMRLEPHTVTGLVTRAEAAGLVTREQCSEDRRRMWIHLTRAGERRLERAVAQLEAQREELLASLEEATGNARAIIEARGSERRSAAGRQTKRGSKRP
jgi:DNA-binding MarR family transcriptional regulator